MDPTSLRASVRVKGRRQGGIPPTKPDWSKRGQQPIRSRLLTETKEKINMNKTQGWNSGWIFRFQSRCRVDPRSAGIQSAPVAFRLRAKLRAKGRSEGGNGAPAIPSCPVKQDWPRQQKKNVETNQTECDMETFEPSNDSVSELKTRGGGGGEISLPSRSINNFCFFFETKQIKGLH